MPRRILQGRVVSTKGAKTATILVERRFKHPLYKKTVKVSKKYHAHDESDSCADGEIVSIIESRPISKTKSWIVMEKEAKK